MAINWEMFGDMSSIEAEVADVSASNVERKEVPYGDYEVRVTKCAIEECPFEGDYQGKPQLAVWFKIINHEELAGQLLFATKRLWSAKGTRATAYMIRNAVQMLDSLESGIEVKFDEHFEDTVKAVFDAVGDGKAEYQLAYHENDKGFKEYDIVQKF